MKTNLLFPAFLLAAATAMAQKDPLAVKYAGYIDVADARKQLTVIASDAFEGRETGRPGAVKAAAYIATEFARLGLQAPVNGSHLLPVPLQEHEVTSMISVNGKELRPGFDVYIPELHQDHALNKTGLVFVGYGTPKELGNADLNGKIVLWINEDVPKPGVKQNTNLQPSEERSQALGGLVMRGASVIIGVNRELDSVMNKFRESLIEPPMTVKSDESPQLPGPMLLLVPDATAQLLLQRSGKTYQELRNTAGAANTAQTLLSDIRISYAVKSNDMTASDVLGFLPGTDLKDEVVVFSAHYDHIGLTASGVDKVNNGADDDGSGTTGIIQIAKAFAQARKEGHGPRRSILFLANVGEEKGLLGSQYYVEHPVYPLSSTVADLNIDMIGRVGYDYDGKADSANYVYLIGSGMLSSELKKISENANDTYTGLHVDYKYDDPDDPEKLYYRSDHYNFAKNDIPIVFYTDGEHKDYHQPGDEVGKINFPLLVKRAQLAFYTGWDLANRDKRPALDAK